MDPELTRLAVLAQRLLGVDFCAVNVLDDDQQWSVSGTPGVPVGVSARAASLCHRVLARSGSNPDVFVTTDASQDPSLADSPWVNGDAGSIRFYAAAPLVAPEGEALGTVCVWSERPFTVQPHQVELLGQLRDEVMRALEERRAGRGVVNAPGAGRQVQPPATARGGVGDAGSVNGNGAWTIHSVIDDRAVRTVFQPVVHLESGTVAGFEALSRGPVGSALESPMALIQAATAAGRLGELDWLCRVHAMQAAVDAQLHPSLSWLINVEPAGLAIECPEHLLPSLARARLELRAILEVVERDVEGYATELLHATDRARRDSWGVALDDVGAEEGSLALLPFLRPDVVKLDMTLVRSVPKAGAAAITSAVRAYAERTGAVILAEGIETEEHEHLARVFGATYGQGYRYGRPGPLPDSVPTPRHVIPLRQSLAPLDGQSPFEVLAARTEPHRAAKQHLLHISRHLEDQNAAEGNASVLLACFQDRKFFTVKQWARYSALSKSNALTVVLADDLQTYDEPRFHVGPPKTGSRLGQEWVVIVINPHYAAAFVGRDCGDTGPDQRRRFDYIYTHDRDNVIAAARAYLQEMKQTPRSMLDTVADLPATATRADHRPTAPDTNSRTHRRVLAARRGRRSA